MTAQLGWLVSYPKSGNTWLRMMLASLLTDGAPVDINRSGGMIAVCSYAEMDELLGIESSELTGAEIADARPALHAAIAAASDRPLVLRKVHDRYWRTRAGAAAFPGALSRGAFYLVRDPRDVAVSFAHHRGLGLDRIIDVMADESFELAVFDDRQGVQLPQPLGSWSGHVASWLGQTEIATRAVRFEDLLIDPVGELAAIAAHLGIAATPRTLAAAVASARFETLQTQERAQGFVERRPGSTAMFFRTGRSGGWRDRLSAAQAAAITAAQGAAMARLGYG
jgi:aryl sulfotransferase